jgi:hypothetical protein
MGAKAGFHSSIKVPHGRQRPAWFTASVLFQRKWIPLYPDEVNIIFSQIRENFNMVFRTMLEPGWDHFTAMHMSIVIVAPHKIRQAGYSGRDSIENLNSIRKNMMPLS